MTTRSLTAGLAVVAVFAGISFALAGTASGQVIMTIAGSGPGYPSPGGYCGDGGAATTACLDHPTGIALDAAGTLFIADGLNHRVRKVDVSGVITTVAGNGTQGFCGDEGPATDACLSTPAAVSVDSTGTIFIADTGNNRIRRVDADGTISTFAGNGSAAYCGDGGPAADACLKRPRGVLSTASGTVLIADTENNRIRSVDAGGTISTYAGNGTEAFCGDGGPAKNACIWWPTDVALNTVGALFIADRVNHRIRKVDAAGAISTVAGNGAHSGGDGGPATSAGLNGPGHVTLDANGALFIAESNRVRMVDSTGIISTAVGNGSLSVRFCGDGGSPTKACLGFPTGIVFNASGELLIADYHNNRVRKVADGFKSLTVSKAIVSGCVKNTGRVTMLVPADGGLIVDLSSDSPHATVPRTVKIYDDGTTKPFAIQTAAVSVQETVNITASVGTTSRTVSFVLKPMAPKSVTLDPNPVVGGNVVSGLVTLECAAGPGDIIVNLSSSKPTVAAPSTSSVTVVKGATTAPFLVETQPVEGSSKPVIRATANGVTKSKTLVVNPGS